MSVIDRFICRREGHIPTVEVTRFSGMEATPYFTTCHRCGKWITVMPDGSLEAAAQEKGQASAAASSETFKPPASRPNS